MVIKNVVRGIGLVLVMMSVIWLVMAAPSGITDLKNITYAQDYITWTWTDPTDSNFTHVTISINGAYVTNVTKGNQSYNATGLTADTSYTISTQTVDDNFSANATLVTHTARTAPVPDSTAPSSITNLQNTTYASNYINWTWNDPGDPDFSKVMIYINDLPQPDVNKGVQLYSATGLTPETDYIISTQTVDTNGNINSTWVNRTTRTAPLDIIAPASITNLQNSLNGPTYIKWTWTDPTDSDFDHVMIYINGSWITNVTRSIQFYNATTGLAENTEYIISTHTVDTSGNINATWVNHTSRTKYPSPTVSSFSVSSPPAPSADSLSFESIGKETVNFTVSFSQDVTITWWKNSNPVTGVSDNFSSYYLESSPSTGTWNISAVGTNANGSAMKTWNWTVRSKTYKTGNRVWDENKDMSLQYTWNPMSFYAFYYDVNDNVGSESLEINLDSKSDRSIERDDLIYRTTTDTVSFKFKGWGSYKVIGFMADKYFAAYTASTSTDITKGSPVSTIGYSQLHRVLMDDKDSHTVRTSTTYPLGDGYAVTLKDIGAGRLAWISILKDGGEVYSDFASENGTLVYSKKVGSVNDLPLIAIHVKNVFMGTTDNAVFIDGIFQISESYTSASSSNRYGIMEITDTSETGITMKNRNSFTLSSGSTIDIMGDMKFIVAKNDKLRFAPMIKRSGEYEVRGSISDNETDNEWTPLNFEGFYYNLDEDVGTEKLTLTRSGRTVAKDKVTYNTSAQQVSFKYNGLGKYYVIGFMADKYFAGYIGGGAITTDDISTIEHNQLHKVEIDDDTQRIIYAGSTLTLNDGYVIKIKDVNMGAGTPSVWLTVLKDGNEVFDDFKEKGQVFIYSKDVGAVKNLPLISLRIENIFRGKEATAAFVKGTFQIDEAYTSVNNGDKFDKMEVTEITKTSIKMTNPNTVTLSSASTVDLMKNIKFKVADSSDIRFYPYILVNGSALASNQLAIGVPPSMMVKDTISISVTSGTGTPQDNAEVSFDGTVIGSTNSTGKLDYMLTKAGQHNLTATKLGYEKAIKTIQIAEYVDNRLNFELPEFIDQYIPVSIKIRVSGSGNVLSGANITLDGTGIGATDSSGVLTYTFTASGKHNLAASKSGYISVHREIDVRMPFIEFKALDINFRPDVVAKGQNVYIWSNITNSGTKEGTLPVALIINSTVVENSNVTLAPGKYGRVNFSRKIDLLPGNYTVEILGQKTTMPVKEEPLNLFLVAGLITGLGVIAVYFLTSKNLMSVEALKSKMNMETVNRIAANAKSNIQDLASKLTKKGGKGGMVPPKYDPFSKFNK